MSPGPRYLVYTDGASRGNPGRASIGAVVLDEEGREVATASEAIGHATNNVAEYRALERALELLADLGATAADFRLDSELIVRQLEGVYRVKDPKMRAAYERVKRALHGLQSWSVRHVPRADNARADALANEALDREAVE
jgi:ribonuclease HI